MMVVISYDIAITVSNGTSRLRRVAKLCQDYGTRVQNSVFECIIDYQTYLKLKSNIISEIEPKYDSVRFYELGNKFQGHVVHVGAKKTWDLTDTLII